MFVINKLTGRDIKLSTAIKKGLYVNPSNFGIPNDLFINKNTNRIIKKSTAEKLLREGKDIFYNKEKIIVNPFTFKLLNNTKKNEYIKNIKTGKKEIKNQLTDYKFFSNNVRKSNLSKVFNSEILMNRLEKQIKILFNKNKRQAGKYNYFQISLALDNNINATFGSKYDDNLTVVIRELFDKIQEALNRYQEEDNDTDIFAFNKININFIEINQNVGGSSCSISNNKFVSDKYDVISPKTFTNCLFTSYIIAENDGNEINNLSLYSTKLKSRCGIKSKGLIGREEVEILSNYKKRHIYILDCLFNTSYITSPKKVINNNPIVLQLSENHFKACVSKKQNEEKEEKQDIATIIKKPIVNNKEINNNIAVWKMTTKTDNDNLLCDYIDFVDIDNIHTFKNELEFLDFINNNFDKYNNYTFYSHKGGKIDLKILINTLSTYDNFKINNNKVIDNNNIYINLEINKNGKKINFNDSHSILCCELDELYNSFNIKDNSIKGLLEILLNFNKTIFEKLNISITDALTSNSIAKKNFFNNYYNSFKHPIYNLTEKEDIIIRKGFLGGRNECFQMGLIKDKIYTFDFTSLYPKCGTYLLPYGKPEISNIQQDKILNLNDLSKMGFFSVYVKTINFNKKPLHGIKNNIGRLIFQHFKEWTKLESLFTEEIKKGIKNNLYEYKFISGYVFSSARILEKYFTDSFKGKQEAKATNNKPMEKVYKTILNSGYGFWGQKTIREGLKVFNKDDKSLIIPLIHNKQLIKTPEEVGNYTFVKYAKKSKTNQRNISIASAISSYGRIMLYNVINDIEDNGGKVYYCDTDSVFTNYNIHNNPILFKKYGNGKALGTLKNECADNTYYDELYIGGCKYYSLIHKNKDFNINKLKGYQNKDNTLNIRNNEEITQIQKEYRNNNFNIKVKNITKRFNCNYSKGKINKDGTITPFTN